MYERAGVAWIDRITYVDAHHGSDYSQETFLLFGEEGAVDAKCAKKPIITTTLCETT
jgi:hypothetical protein